MPYSRILVRYLPSFMIQVVVIPSNQLRDRNKLIPLILQCCNQSVQRIRRVLGPVVAQNDASVSEVLVLRYSLDDGIYAVVFPVERIHIPLNRVVSAVFRYIYDIIVLISVGRSE